MRKVKVGYVPLAKASWRNKWVKNIFEESLTNNYQKWGEVKSAWNY